MVEEARSGSEEAWRELFAHHYPAVFRYFRARLDSPEVCEDLAAQVFLETVQSLPRFRWRERPFESWLFGIARRRLLAYERGRRETAELRAGVPGIRDEFLGVEVQDVLARLPDGYRDAIEYRYVIGLSGAEAAAAMGKSHGAFRQLLFRATRAFRREYGGAR